MITRSREYLTADEVAKLREAARKTGRYGHTQPRTTYRYVNATVETAQRAAAILDSSNDHHSVVSEAVN